jgi:predicted CoA-binding protein
MIFARLNVDEQRRIADKFGVLTIPLLKVFCNGRSVIDRAGFMPEPELRKFVDMATSETQSCVSNSTMLLNAKISEPETEQDLLLKSKTIAIVGLSKDQMKDSYSVAEYLKGRGYRIIPINPTAKEILGEKAYPTLLEIPAELAKRIDVVDIFRPSDQVPPIVDHAIELRKKFGTNPRAVWMQLGIENPAAAEKARKAGLSVTQDMCIAVEHRRRTFLSRSGG